MLPSRSTGWYEDAALTAFVHFDKPDWVPVERWGEELAGFERHASRWAELAAGPGRRRSCSPQSTTTPGPTGPRRSRAATAPPRGTRGVDTLAPTRAACLEHGLRFGIYYSLVDNWHPGYAADMADYVRFQYLQMEELIDSYEPSIVWLDGHWDQPNADWEYDSLVSLIHARAPACVVANNPGRRTLDVSEFGRGDVDVRTFEGHSPTDHMPRPRGSGPNPRPLPAEKVSFTCNWWSPGHEPGQAGCTRNRDAGRVAARAVGHRVRRGTLQLGLGPGYPGAPAGAPPPASCTTAPRRCSSRSAAGSARAARRRSRASGPGRSPGAGVGACAAAT